MKKALIYISLIFLGIALILNGCKKDRQDDPPTYEDSDVESSKDIGMADQTYEDVQAMADQAHAAGTGGTLTSYRMTGTNSLLSSCATISITFGGSDTTITIDFGTYFCHCADGRFRKGQVLVTFTGRYRDSSTVITHSFNNYYVGRDTIDHVYHVQGTKTVTNMGRNTNGNLYFNIQVNGTLTNHAGQTMTWNSTRSREWSAGESTSTWLDDEYKITGNASGMGFNGSTYMLNISQALHVALSCLTLNSSVIKDGKLDFTPSGKPTRYVDYSYPSGACDNQAKVTINGHDYFVTLQ